jgi:hypothetical protein
MTRPLASASDAELLARVAAMDAALSPAPPIDTAALTFDWRALTIRQPWADAVIRENAQFGPAAKRIENRTRRTHRRGWVLLHSGGEYDLRAADHLVMRQWCNATRYGCGALGAIVGLATITGCHEADNCCAPWGEPGPGIFHWGLADEVRRLAEPVPCKGALGFWRPSADVLAAVLKQLGGAS